MGRRIGVFLSFATLIFEVLSSLVLTPFIIRSFGQSEYGVYSLVLSITAYLTLLDLGVGNSVIKFASKYIGDNDKEKLNKFAGIIYSYYFIVAIIVLIIGVVLYFVFPTAFGKGLSTEEILLAQKLLIVSIVNMSITIGTSGFFNIANSFENFYATKGIMLIFMVIRIATSFVLLYNGFRSFEIILLNTITVFLGRFIIVLIVLLKHKVVGTLRGVKWIDIKEIISFSFVILLAMIATQINGIADNVLLGILVENATPIIAIYSVGATISLYYQSFGNLVNGVLMPGVVKKIEKNATSIELENEMIKFGRINTIFLGLILIVFIFNGQFFINHWAGVENQQAYYVAIILMVPWFLIMVQNIGLQMLLAKNKHKVQAILKFLIVAINVAITIFLIRINALIGAVVGTAISLLLGDFLVMQIVFKKYLKINLFRYYRELFKGIGLCLFASCVIGLIFLFIPMGDTLRFFLSCSIMSLVYILCLLIFGLNRDEKRLFVDIFRLFLDKLSRQNSNQQ